MTGIKLIRFIALSKAIGRRKIFEYIRQGLVRVNGKVEYASTRLVNPVSDVVTLKGERVGSFTHIYILMYKPRKVVCTRADPEGRTTVIDLLPARFKKVFPVGRLDYNTTGVVLLTNDGLLANRLMAPGRIKRTYFVKLKGDVSEGSFSKWKRGVVIDGKKTLPAEVTILSRRGQIAKVTLTVKEGRYHLIGRLAEKTGMRVMKIHRVGFGPLTVGGLRPGSFRHLRVDEIDALKRIAGLK